MKEMTVSDPTQTAVLTSSPATADPLAKQLLESLVADYNAGRLPDDVRERFEAIRDEYADSTADRMSEAKGDFKAGVEDFVNDLTSRMRELEMDPAEISTEVVDSRLVPVMADAADALSDSVIGPIIDATEDVIHDTFGAVDQLLQLRAAHDPDGVYGERVAAAQAELAQVGDDFDASLDLYHDQIDAAHDATDALRTEANEFHAHNEPTTLIRATTVDPKLPEQMAEETGEGAA
jgi:hypothetical protein